MSERLLYGNVVTQATDALLEGQSVEIRGLPGAGRTTIVRELARQLRDRDVTVVYLTGIATPTPFPLGAMVASDMSGVSGKGNPNLFSAVHDLTVAMGDGLTVIIVDDADLLDEASVRTLLVARANRGVPIIATTRPNAKPLRDSLLAHVTDRVLIPLVPLTPDQIKGLLRERMGVSLDARSVATISSLSGGLPALVVGIGAAIRDSGGRAPQGRLVWGESFQWDERLVALVENLLVDLEPSEFELLRGIATAGSFPTASVIQPAALTGIDALRRAGLIHEVYLDGQRELAVYPPIVTTYLLQKQPPLSAVHVRELLGTVPMIEHRQASSGREWTLSLLSNRIRDYWDRRFYDCKKAWEGNPVASTALPYCVAASRVSSDLRRVSAIVEATDVSEPGWSRVALRCWYATYLAIVHNDPDQAGQWLARTEDDDPDYSSAVAAVRTHISCYLQTDPPIELPDAPTDDEQPEAADMRRIARAEVLVLRGEPAQVIEESALFTHTAFGNRSPDDAIEGMALFLQGNLNEAANLALERYESVSINPLVSWASCHAYVASLSLALSGRIDEFDEHVQAVQASVGANLNLHYLVSTFSNAAMVYYQLGMMERATAAVERAVDLEGSSDFRLGPPAVVVRGIIEGHADQEADELWEVARKYFHRGQRLGAILVGVRAVELEPREAWAQTLGEWAGQTSSPVLSNLAKYAGALSSGDSEQLLGTGESLFAAGLRLPAVVAQIRAAVIQAGQGDVSSATAIADKLWSLLEPSDVLLSQAFAPLVSCIGLTRREREIAAMVGEQISNAQIAEFFTLSSRTVEQHILRACRKLGVVTRTDLAHLAQTWLAPFV